MSKCEFMNIGFAPVLRRGNHEIEEEIKEASTNYGDIENIVFADQGVISQTLVDK